MDPIKKLLDASRTLSTASCESDVLRAEKGALGALQEAQDTFLGPLVGHLAGQLLVKARRARVLLGMMEAARRKKSKPRGWVEGFLVGRAARRVRDMYPQILRLHLVGSRLRHEEARDIEFIAVVPGEVDMPARNILDVTSVDGVDVDLFFATPDEVDFSILEFGLGFDIMRWKRAAIAKGLKLNRYGLWKNNRKVARSIEEVAKILKMPLKPFLVWSRENPM